MSKDDLVYLSMKNLNKPLRFFKGNENGIFCEAKKETWEDFFKTHGNSQGLEDFMADREQDTPRDIHL